MATGYRFDDFKPERGSKVHAFRSEKGMREFAKLQGKSGPIKFWRVEGSIISDDGDEDGLVIKVDSVTQI